MRSGAQIIGIRFANTTTGGFLPGYPKGMRNFFNEAATNVTNFSGPKCACINESLEWTNIGRNGYNMMMITHFHSRDTHTHTHTHTQREREREFTSVPAA